MLIPCQGHGGQCLSQQHLRVQGGLTLYRTPSFTGLLTLSHAHSDQDKVGTANWPNCTSLGCGWKLESPEKTHTHMGKTCKPHRQWRWLGIYFFPPHQHYIITTLFKNLLYIQKVIILSLKIFMPMLSYLYIFKFFYGENEDLV